MYERVVGYDRKSISILGLSFKPNTPVIQESPSLKLAERLVKIGKEVNLYDPDYILISDNNSLDFSWDFGDGNFSNYQNCEHIYQNEGNYQVILKIISPIARCEKTYSEYINLKSDFYFYSPDVFTPNNDGLNDKFKIFVNGVRKFNLYIYDRYGNLVFETDKIDRTWDGTKKGKLLPQGNYSFKCLMVKENDIVEFKKFGSIKLIR